MSEKSKLNRYRNGFRGEMWKQGKVIKKWKVRYFVLEQYRLRCYNDSNMDSIHAELIIDDSMQIYDVPEGSEEHNNAFFLLGKSANGGAEEVFLLACNSEREKQEWVEALVDGVHNGFKQICQPDLWPTPFYPTVDLFLQFSCGGVNNGVENGNILRPFNTEVAPVVTVKGATPEDRFSFVMVDIDPISSPENANSKFFLHWGVVNFSGTDVSTGDELAPYLAPAPVYNSGLHRFFFLLFKQKSPISSSQLSEIVELFNQRDGFAFNKWIRRMSFTGTPAAINGFYAGWEEYCDTIHEKIGYVPPEQYRSPTQESRVQREEDRRRLEHTKLALYKDLGLRDIFGLAEDDPKLLTSECAGMRIVYVEEGNIVPIDGAVLTPAGTMRMPEITFEQLPMNGDYYTLVMTDPDAPSRLRPDYREFVHWVVMNIDGSTGADVASGVTVLPYLGPAPPYSSGLHRYVFTLYKQKDKIASKDLEAATSFFEPRGGLRTYQYIRNQADKFFAQPVAIDAFLSEWDQIVDEFHEKMHWLPPDPFRSPKQKLEAMQNDMASMHDLEKDKETLKKQQDAWELEQYERLKAAEEIYKSRANDIDLLALTAAVRAADVENSSDADVLASASRDAMADLDNIDGTYPSGSSTGKAAGSSQKAAGVHKKPVSFHTSATAVSTSAAEGEAFDSYLQKNNQAVDRSVLDKASKGKSVVVEEISQTFQSEETHRERVEETSEITKTVDIRGGNNGGTRSILDRLDQELAAQEAQNAKEQAEQARLLQIKLAAEEKEQERLKQQRDKEEAAAKLAAAEAEKQRLEQLRQEELARAEAQRLEQARLEAERQKREQAEKEKQEKERIEREKAEKERIEREKAEAERLQRIVDEQKRIIEMQQQQQQLLIQQQQLFLQQQQQQQQQQQELLQRSNSNSRRGTYNTASPSASLDQGDNDSIDYHPHYAQPSSAPAPPVYSSPSAGSGKRVGFSPSASHNNSRPTSLSHSHSNDSDDNASNGSRPGSVASSNSRSSHNSNSNSNSINNNTGRPAVGIQRSPSMIIRDNHHNLNNNNNNNNNNGVGTRSPMLSPQHSGSHHNNHLVHHDDLDAMLQPGRSSVNLHHHDYDDDATITSMGSLIPPSGRSISPPPSRPTSVSSALAPVPPPPINTGSPSWNPAQRQYQQASPSSYASNNSSSNANNNSNNNSNNNNAAGSQPGTPASTLIRRASLFRPTSQLIQLPQGQSVDDSDNHSATSAYTMGGTPIQNNMPGAYMGQPNNKPAALLKQTTSMYLKSGAGTSNPTSAQDALTAASGLSAEEVKERLLDNATPTTEKCVIFNISSPAVFDGENVKKKFSKDFLAKDSYMWVDPLRKSLHWGKSAADKNSPAQSKFINLDRVNAMDSVPPHLRPQGEIKGLFKSLELNGTTITVTCENGDSLVMKINEGNPPPAKRAADWAKMIKSFAS